jgi:hypothetical protein
VTLTVERNLAAERHRVLRAVPSDLQIAARALDRFAAQRAGDRPIRDADGRDFATEVLEELADARNYLVWWAEQLERLGRPELAPTIDAALLGVVSAWQHATDAQHMAGPAPRVALARAIATTASSYPRCRCQLHARLSDDELRVLGAGCTGPQFCCPRLDAVRRRVL